MHLLNLIIKKLKKIYIQEVLGLLGVFPFLLIIILSVIDNNNLSFFVNFVVFYLFLIISFIGAIYWGIAISLKKKNSKLVIFSVLPSILVSVVYILKIPVTIKIFMGIFFLNSIYFYEKNYCKSYLPNWYLRLRKNLNILVTFSVLIMVVIYLICKT